MNLRPWHGVAQMIEIDWKPDGHGGWSVTDETKNTVEAVITQLAIQATTAQETLARLEQEVGELRHQITTDLYGTSVVLRQVVEHCNEAGNESDADRLEHVATAIERLFANAGITVPIYVGKQ